MVCRSTDHESVGLQGGDVVEAEVQQLQGEAVEHLVVVAELLYHVTTDVDGPTKEESGEGR